VPPKGRRFGSRQAATASSQALAAAGKSAESVAEARAAIREVADRAMIDARIDAIWIAGFPADGHPARDLRYIERIPLAGG
jgi:hypothetical protein